MFVDAGDLLAMGTTWETLQGDPEAWFTKRFNFSAFLPHSLDYMSAPFNSNYPGPSTYFEDAAFV